MLAFADVKISAAPLHEYELPSIFRLEEATFQIGAKNTSVISATMGTSPETSVCAIVFANMEGAKIVEYKFNGKPTRCLSVLPNPDGGVFIRGDNPALDPTIVSGFTSYLCAQGTETWSIPDQHLIDAGAKPIGTGQFQGTYAGPLHTMRFSKKLNKLIAFSTGEINIGIEQKIISQAHIIDVDDGKLRVSGQTFGQTGIGIVGGIETRNSDGSFILYYYANESQGAFFYTYNGRNKISFFQPRGENWEHRFIKKMNYQNNLLHLLWTSDDNETPITRLTVINDMSAELWTSTFSPKYKFRTGIEINLGSPLTMWTGQNTYLILYKIGDAFFLRHVDTNGGSFGVGKLEGIIPTRPVAVAIDNNGVLRLFGYQEKSHAISEFDLSIQDKPDYDPEIGPQLPEDIGIPGDIGVSQVLEAVGCCATLGSRQSSFPQIILLLMGIFFVHRMRSIKHG